MACSPCKCILYFCGWRYTRCNHRTDQYRNRNTLVPFSCLEISVALCIQLEISRKVHTIQGSPLSWCMPQLSHVQGHFVAVLPVAATWPRFFNLFIYFGSVDLGFLEGVYFFCIGDMSRSILIGQNFETDFFFKIKRTLSGKGENLNARIIYLFTGFLWE